MCPDNRIPVAFAFRGDRPVESSQPVSELRYRAFISYSHRDEAFAIWLHKDLETYRVPSRLVGQHTAAGTIPRRLNPVFRDREELSSSPELGSKINEALSQSENLIVICSPAAATSRWVDEEVLAYKRMGRGDRIFCLIVDGEPNASYMPGREAEECFCAALRFQIGADGQPTRERTEPIAADVREGKDGKSNARLKLIAGMLGVGFDALKQREQQRRVRRMTAIAVLAVIVMLVTSVLAVYALISRHAAVIAQHQAVVARQAAERRQKQAEDLVGFMLGDLTDKLNEVDRLDILQAVDDKALAYFDSLPAADANDDALLLRVKGLQNIGSVRRSQGHIPQALDAFVAATKLAAELLRRSPTDISRQAAYAYSLTWDGYVYWHQGDLDHALQSFQTASASLEQAHATKPADDGLTTKLAIAHNNIGHVLETRGNFSGAGDQYAIMLKLYLALAVRDPKNSKLQSSIGDAWDNLGKLALEQGRLDEAIADYRKDLNIKAVLAARDLANHDAQGNLMVSNAILGRTLALCGDMQAAMRYTQAAVDSGNALSAVDSSDTVTQEDLALYSQQLGGLLRQAGRLDAADSLETEALAIFAALVAKDPSNTGWQKEYAQTRIEAARLKSQQGDLAGAQVSVEAALQTLGALRKQQTSNPSLALLSAQASILLGQITAKRGDEDAARTAWALARDTVTPVVNAGDDPNALATAASASLLLDEDDTARPLLAKLEAMGYQTPDFGALVAAKHVAYTVDAEAVRRIATANQAPVTSKMNP